MCRCDCGNEKVLAKSSVIYGAVKTCGCGIGRSGNKQYAGNECVGKQFGRLTVIYQDNNVALCYCRCGRFVLRRTGALIDGATKSCGCGKLVDRGADKEMPSELFDANNNYIGRQYGEWTIIRQLDDNTLFAGKKVNKMKYALLSLNDIEIEAAAACNDVDVTGRWIEQPPNLLLDDGVPKGKPRATSQKSIGTVQCIVCGKTFIGSLRAKYCDDCWLKQRRSRTMNNYYNRKRNVGDVDRCVDCGKEYVIQSGNQRRCDDCAKKRRRYYVAMREWKLGYRQTKPTYPMPEKIVKNGKVIGGVRICKGCGREFIGAWQARFCPECKTKRQLEAKTYTAEPQEKNEVKPRKITVLATRKCVVCGVEFLGGPSAKYCPNCRAKREKERAARYRKNGVSRKLGSIDYCQACGKEYIVASGLQKYCPECATEQIKMRDRKRGKEYAAEQRKLNPDRVKEWKRVKYKEKTCPVCGKVFTPVRGKQKTCSDTCYAIWHKYREQLGTWRYCQKRGQIYRMPTLESAIEKYNAEKNNFKNSLDISSGRGYNKDKINPPTEEKEGAN